MKEAHSLRSTVKVFLQFLQKQWRYPNSLSQFSKLLLLLKQWCNASCDKVLQRDWLYSAAGHSLYTQFTRLFLLLQKWVWLARLPPPPTHNWKRVMCSFKKRSEIKKKTDYKSYHHKAIFSQLVLDLKGLIVNWAKTLVQVMLRYKLMVLMVLLNVSCAKIISHLLWGEQCLPHYC